MNEVAEAMAKSLLYEGYALYPYTPTATKNATPTPFGIAYPTAYASHQPAAFDHVRIEVVARPGEGARIEGVALFLQAAGTRHQATERRIEIGPLTVAELLAEPCEIPFAFDSAPPEQATGAPPEGSPEVLSGDVCLSATEAGEGRVRVAIRVRNTTPLPEPEAEAMERGEALRRALLSCHTMLGISAGSFASPVENEGELGAAVEACENVNAWPVLASPDDDAVLGAAILLPDHPQIAPQSNVNFFDNTEIEEALVLHVQALSESERAAIDDQDPAVREMIERAEATSQEQILSLHGMMQETELPPLRPLESTEPPVPSPGLGGPEIAFPEWSEPGVEGDEPEPPVRPPPPGPADTAGEEELVVDGKAFKRGGKVILRPGTEGDPYDRMMDGRMATIERIYLDYDGKAYIGVSIDGDPMREILRETGRYLFFFADEVEPA